MHGEVLFRDVARNGHRIKYLHEQVINFDIKALQDFIPECECLSHISRLVIASQHHYVLWEVLLDSEEKNADFDTKDATIDVVSQEEIVERSWFTSFADHIKQVRILSMDIAHYADWLIDLHEVGFC